MKKTARSEVRIAELKAHLSEYLRMARNGEEILIKDRETPVARLAPIRPNHAVLPVVPAARSMAEVEKMLDAAPRGRLVSPDALERALAENKKDVYDKWITGELT